MEYIWKARNISIKQGIYTESPPRASASGARGFSFRGCASSASRQLGYPVPFVSRKRRYEKLYKWLALFDNLSLLQPETHLRSPLRAGSSGDSEAFKSLKWI